MMCKCLEFIFTNMKTILNEIVFGLEFSYLSKDMTKHDVYA